MFKTKARERKVFSAVFISRNNANPSMFVDDQSERKQKEQQRRRKKGKETL